MEPLDEWDPTTELEFLDVHIRSKNHIGSVAEYAVYKVREDKDLVYFAATDQAVAACRLYWEDGEYELAVMSIVGDGLIYKLFAYVMSFHDEVVVRAVTEQGSKFMKKLHRSGKYLMLDEDGEEWDPDDVSRPDWGCYIRMR